MWPLMTHFLQPGPPPVVSFPPGDQIVNIWACERAFHIQTIPHLSNNSLVLFKMPCLGWIFQILLPVFVIILFRLESQITFGCMPAKSLQIQSCFKGGEEAELVKGSSHKSEDLSSNPRTHVKRPSTTVHICHPGGGGGKTGGSLRLTEHPA